MASRHQLRLGAESFWEMAALTMAGRLASCQSCVEHFYFQSKQNAVAFLDSCAEGGLVEKISLLDLGGDIGPRLTPSLRQQWYDQSIYISAPVFRVQNLDAARERIENTKNAVYAALRLYYEVLGADDVAIGAAYMNAVEHRMLRYSDIAKERLDVDLSSVARLRLIQDGFRNSIKNENPTMSRGQVEQRAIDSTAEFVLRFSGAGSAALPHVSDRAEELEEFIIGFLSDRYDFASFWHEKVRKVPADYHFQLLPVIGELARYRCDVLVKSDAPELAVRFASRLREEINKARERDSDNTAYAEGLEELSEDIASCASMSRTHMSGLTVDSGPLEAGAFS